MHMQNYAVMEMLTGGLLTPTETGRTTHNELFPLTWVRKDNILNRGVDMVVVYCGLGLKLCFSILHEHKSYV